MNPIPPSPEKPRLVIRRSAVEAPLSAATRKRGGWPTWLFVMMGLGVAAGAAWYWRVPLYDWSKAYFPQTEPVPLEMAEEAKSLPSAPAFTAKKGEIVEWEVDVASEARWRQHQEERRRDALHFPMPEDMGAHPGPEMEGEESWQTVYQRAIGHYNTAVSNYTALTEDYSRHAEWSVAEQNAAAAVEQFKALQGKAPSEIPLARRIADAEALLKSTREMHRFLSVPDEEARGDSVDRATSLRRAGAQRPPPGPTPTAPATRSAPAPRAAPQTPKAPSR